MMPLDEFHYADLLGTPFKLGGTGADGIDCWELVRLVCERRGILVPERAAYGQHHEAQAVDPQWCRVTESQPGDVVAYSMEGKCVDHVGIVLHSGDVLQAWKPDGVEVVDRRKLRRFERGVYRPGSATGTVTVTTHRNVFDPSDRTIDRRECAVLSDYIPSGIAPERCALSVNGERRPAEYVPRDGDTVEVVVLPGAPGAAAVSFAGATVITGVSVTTAAILAFIGNLIISFGIGFLLQVLTAPSKRATDAGEADPSPTFKLDGIVNTTGSGGLIPIVFGTHRVGGHVISAYNAISALSVTYLPNQTPPVPPNSPPGTQPPLPYNPNAGPNSVVQNTNAASATGGKTTLNILIALSEGPVQSINGVSFDIENFGVAGMASGNLLINGNDASSFSDVQISQRTGTIDQPPISGFTDAITGIAQEFPLKYLKPFTYTTTTDVEAFAIQMFEPNGHYRTGTSGNNTIKRKFAQYKFQYRPVGATAWTETSIVERTYLYRAAHSWEIRRDNLPLGKYELYIERTSPDDDDPSFISSGDLSEVSLASVNAINEITYDTQSFPGVALLALKILASDQLNGPPTVTSLVEGVKCWSSVDGTTWTEAWSDDPAVIAQEVLLNQTWGLGRYLAPKDIQFSEFADLSTYTGTSIDDGRGGTMTRARFDYVYDRTEKAADLLDRVLFAAHASLAPSNGKIGVRIEQAASPTHLFTEASLADLEVSYLDDTDRPTRVNVQFANAELDYDIDTVSVEDQDVSSGEFREETIQALGVTKPARAYRIAKRRLNVVSTLRKVIRFRAAIDAILLQPGDTFYVAHQQMSSAHTTGRIATDSPDATHVFLDREMTIAASDKIRVMTTGTGSVALQESTITTTGFYQGGQLTVSPAFSASDLPQVGNVYAVGPSATYLHSYRVLGVTLEPNLTRTIEAIQYDATVYDDDPGDVPESTDLLVNRKDIPAAVENLVVREENRITPSGDVSNVLVVSWTAAADSGTVADVWMRDPDDDGSVGWDYLGEFPNGRAEIHQLGVGDVVTVSVCPVSPNGTRRGPEQGTRANAAVRGKLIPPATVTGFSVSEAERDLVFRWDANAEKDIDCYEIRVGVQWICALPVATACDCDTSVRVPIAVPRGTGVTPKYWIKARNTTGIESESAASATYEWTGDGTFEAHSASSHTGWTGTKTGMSVSGGDLVADASATTLGYTTIEHTVAGNKRHAYPTDMLRVKVNYRTSQTWAELDFTWGSAAARQWTWGGDDFTDYPDTLQDARGATWADLNFTWGGAIMAGRTWAALGSNFFAQSHEMKEDSAAAYASASFDRFVPAAPKLASYGFKHSLTIPDDDYLVTFDDEFVGLYERDLSRDGWDYDDPFIGSSTEGGEIGVTGWSLTGTSATVVRGTQDEATHPGQYTIGTTNATGNIAALNCYNNGFRMAVSTGVRQRYRFAWYAVDTSSCEYIIGFMNSAGTASPTRQIAFGADAGGNWTAYTTDASSTTSTDLGVALSARWLFGEILILSTGSVKFTLDSGGTLYTATHTTNIPTDTLGPVFLVATSANAVKSLTAKRFSMKIDNIAVTS